MEYRHRAFWPPDMPRSLAPARTTLHDMLESAAQRFPGNPATIFQDETLTWAEVRRRVDALAGHLRQECGVRRGDRVLLDLQNGPEFVIACFAVLRADAVVVPVGPMNLAGELAITSRTAARRWRSRTRRSPRGFRDCRSSI